MPDEAWIGGSRAAGFLCSGGVIAAAWQGPPLELPSRIARLKAALGRSWRTATAARWLAAAIERAGWRETPQRVAAMAVALALSMAAAGSLVGPIMAPVGLVTGCVVVLACLSTAAERRRRHIAGELVPLLELFTLELSGGGSALAALGSVTVQVEGELAADLRRMLIASQVTGSVAFESRLLDYAERTGIGALASLATLLTASREYGTGTSQGVRALATDLRRAQRRELITHSRKALNQVLLPAAVGILLPFLGVLMFPAMSVLQGSLR